MNIPDKYLLPPTHWLSVAVYSLILRKLDIKSEIIYDLYLDTRYDMMSDFISTRKLTYLGSRSDNAYFYYDGRCYEFKYYDFLTVFDYPGYILTYNTPRGLVKNLNIMLNTCKDSKMIDFILHAALPNFDYNPNKSYPIGSVKIQLVSGRFKCLRNKSNKSNR